MNLYYSIAKEGKYKTDEQGNYIDCAIAVNSIGDEPNNEEIRLARAKNKKDWVSQQINVNPFFIVPIVKEAFDNYDNIKVNVNGKITDG